MSDFNDISNKLDKLIQAVSAIDGLTSRLYSVEGQLRNVSETVTDLNRTVRGSNGYPGLVTEVALIKDAVTDCNGGDEKKEKSGLKDDISWQWLVEKAFMPVVVALILWVALTFLPEVFRYMGGTP